MSYFNGLITIIIVLAVETGKLTLRVWQTDDSLQITRTANWSSFDNVHRLSGVLSPLPISFPTGAVISELKRVHVKSGLLMCCSLSYR